MTNKLLPTGHHWGLHIEHDLTGNGGELSGGGHKLVWHTTEGLDLRTMQSVLKGKDAEPHLLIGRVGTGREDFTVVQFIPFTEGSRALEHPGGTAPTNNANCIQVEVCEFAGRAREWRSDLFEALGALIVLVEHRVSIPRRAPRTFTDKPNRYTESGWIHASGHVGHQHAPSQPKGHWDPGAMQIGRAFRAATHAQSKYGT